MKASFIVRKLLQGVCIPVLVFAISTSVAQGQGHDHHDDHDDHHDQHDNQHDQHGQDFRFHDQDRGHFAPHYQKDVNRWQHNSHGRPHFERGERIPANYHFQAVPRSYYAQVPPPPGYQYGYYDGYVVAYDPTTRVIADVLDLVSAAANR
jgi:Ni/Co efflux regulator RcnB